MINRILFNIRSNFITLSKRWKHDRASKELPKDNLYERLAL